MNWKIVLIGLISFMFLSACTNSIQESDELPADFKLNYSSGAMHLDWGSNEFEVNTLGNAVYLDKIGMNMVLKYEFTATKEELIEIYKTAVKNNFFSLNNESDPSIMDGGWNKISITADGKNNTVTMTNTYNNQFDAVEKEINKLIKLKIPQAFEYDSFQNACPEKETECIESNSKECIEWKEFCLNNDFEWK
ncbi:MAG: hypothetical protein JW703_02170 [Candidatus Diapherotrites archaeon]|nr:hypothetical protein [Candidatus Diapherotrites archaeon]